jgi:CBS domain-containing protein
MKVADVMTPGIDIVDPSASVQAAATQMAELDVGAVMIGTAEAVEGILTDRDILVRVVVEGRNPGEVTVSDVMTPEVTVCRAEDTIEDAFAQMREGQFRRMPVIDENGKPIGVVALSDLAKNVESPEKLAETLREISEPHRSRKDPAEAAESEPAASGEALSDADADTKKAVAAASKSA